MEDNSPTKRRWSEDETILALFLYFQLPFGKLHSKNPEIRQLAEALERSSDSVAMKLCNFASLDPKVLSSGRKGLAGASALDRSTYDQFAQDWLGLVEKAQALWTSRVERETAPPPTSREVKDIRREFNFRSYDGPSATHTIIAARVGQGFFRRSVLANYEDSCCITGIADSRLLTASHIKPWGADPSTRHNPANGLLLCATLDRAFDRGLITVTQNNRVCVSRELIEHNSRETREYFAQFENIPLRTAKRFDPDPTFTAWHRTNCFVDAQDVRPQAPGSSSM